MTEAEIAVRSLNPETMPKPFGYSQVVEVSGGRTVYISGQVPLDADNTLIGEGDVAAQIRQAFENVRLGLEAVGMTFDNVVKMQFYLTDIANLLLVREVRDEYVNTSQPPASTLVAVSALFRPDVFFELDVIAVG